MLDLIIFLLFTSLLYFKALFFSEEGYQNYFVATIFYMGLMFSVGNIVNERDVKIFELVKIIEDNNITLDISTHIFLENIKIDD